MPAVQRFWGGRVGVPKRRFLIWKRIEMEKPFSLKKKGSQRV